MKLAIAAVITVAVGLAAVWGVYRFQESRMTPADLDALREAERKLVEAEEASEALDTPATETDPASGAIDMAQAEDPEPPAPPREWKQIDTPAYKTTEPFYVKFDCSMGDFVAEFHPEWSPNGVKRMHELISIKFFDDIRFFRVVEGFMAQFGISGDPALSREWGNANIPDDRVVQSNTRGYISFAMGGPNTRSTQLFINFGDNSRLDHYSVGFPPIGRVVDGMDAVDKIFSGYGDMPSQGGTGPRPDLIESAGNKYLNDNFPKLDYIKKARFVEPVEAEPEADDEVSEAA